MLYHIKGISFLVPQKLLPSVLSIPESNPTRETKGGKVIHYAHIFHQWIEAALPLLV